MCYFTKSGRSSNIGAQNVAENTEKAVPTEIA